MVEVTHKDKTKEEEKEHSIMLKKIIEPIWKR